VAEVERRAAAAKKRAGSAVGVTPPPTRPFSVPDVVAAGAGIANYRALAYRPESARKILGNVLIYVTLE
jgi:hypothetical protein